MRFVVVCLADQDLLADNWMCLLTCNFFLAIRFKDFVSGFYVVNDVAERGIKLGQDFMQIFKKEEDKQAYLVVALHCSKFKKRQ